MLNQIHRLRMNDMIYFYPNDIIFMTNGWDSSDKEEDVISIWKKFKSYLRYKWPYVKEKNIFRTNRRYVITRLLGYIYKVYVTLIESESYF